MQYTFCLFPEESNVIFSVNFQVLLVLQLLLLEHQLLFFLFVSVQMSASIFFWVKTSRHLCFIMMSVFVMTNSRHYKLPLDNLFSISRNLSSKYIVLFFSFCNSSLMFAISIACCCCILSISCVAEKATAKIFCLSIV